MKTFKFPRKTTALFFPLLLALCTLGSGLVFQSCAPKLDKTALENVTKITSSLPGVMEKAIGNYASNETAVTAALSGIESAYQHAASKNRNTEVKEQWRILRDDMAKPFFDKWKSAGKLDKDFIKEAVKQVKTALGAIEKAERAKGKK